ncbi:MAG: PDZ domain-containing protein [Acidobacteriota bacterium]
MIRRPIILFFAVASACAFVAGAQTPRCPEGHPATGDIGIESLLCVAGSCSVNLQTGRGYAHDFSTEPRIRGIEPGGPASGKLRDGDILISIDGVLITTREGGRRLANLTPGKPVELRIRRGDKEMNVTVVPKLGCNMPRLAVLGGPQTAPALQRDRVPLPSLRNLRTAPAPVDFGMEIDCGSCGWRYAEDGGVIFQTADPPVVVSVAPGGPAEDAGLRPGDILLQVERQSIASPAGAGWLGRLRPGDSVTLGVGRGGSLRSVEIVPRRPSPRRQAF